MQGRTRRPNNRSSQSSMSESGYNQILARTLSEAWAVSWTFFGKDYQTSTAVNAEAERRARDLLALVAERAGARIDLTPDPARGLVIRAVRRLADGYVLMSTGWSEPDIPRSAMPRHLGLIRLFTAWGVFDWCARHGYPLVDVESDAQAKARQPEPGLPAGASGPANWERQLADTWERQLADDFSRVWDNYCRLDRLLADRADREWLLLEGESLLEPICRDLAGFLIWERVVRDYGGSAAQPRGACDFGAALCGFIFLVFTAADVQELSNVTLPNITSLAGALEDLKVTEWVERHRSSAGAEPGAE
jgi:hypothetical protein